MGFSMLTETSTERDGVPKFNAEQLQTAWDVLDYLDSDECNKLRRDTWAEIKRRVRTQYPEFEDMSGYNSYFDGRVHSVDSICVTDSREFWVRGSNGANCNCCDDESEGIPFDLLLNPETFIEKRVESIIHNAKSAKVRRERAEQEKKEEQERKEREQLALLQEKYRD